MIVIGIILIILMLCMMCGLASATTNQEAIIKNQIEIIRVLKNK